MVFTSGTVIPPFLWQNEKTREQLLRKTATCVHTGPFIPESITVLQIKSYTFGKKTKNRYALLHLKTDRRFKCISYNAHYSHLLLFVPLTDLKIKNIKAVCKSVVLHQNIKMVMVRSGQRRRWEAVASKTKDFMAKIVITTNYDSIRQELLLVDQTGQYANPLMKNVVVDSIPQYHEDLIGGITTKFNIYRQAVFEKFNSTSKLSNPIQALSLNGISISSPYQEYGFEARLGEWEDFVSNQRRKIVNSLLVPEKYHSRGLIDDFAITAECFLTRLPAKIDTFRSSDFAEAEYGKQIILLLDNISNKLNHNWNATECTEDTFTLAIIDPILTSFFGNTLANTTLHGNDHELHESKERKISQAI